MIRQNELPGNGQYTCAPGSSPIKDVKEQYRGRWFAVLRESGIPDSYLTGRHGPCPACGGTDRFRFDDRNGDGTYHCNQCGAGDGLKLLSLTTGKSYNELLPVLRTFKPVFDAKVRQPVKREKTESPEAASRRLKETWGRGVAITGGDTADRYLKARGIVLGSYPDCLRLVPELEYWEKRETKFTKTGVYPAMLSRVENLLGELVSVHRTYLDLKAGKAKVPEPKKLMKVIGTINGAAIRLYPVGEVLAIAEGIETALAVHLMSGLPVWATVTANGMETLEVPETVKELVIAADNDASETGLRSAEQLAKRQTRNGIKCKIIMPDVVGTDWADELMKGGSHE